MRPPRHRRARVTLTGLLLVLLVGTGLLSGCSDNEGTNDGGYISGDGQVVQYAPDDRDEPVELSGESLQGDAIDLADLRGQVVVVNVWASWCGPCRVEMPMLVEAAAALADDPGDVEFVGVNVRDSADNGLAFEREMGVDYPSVLDPSGRALLAFHGVVNPKSIPTTLVLDREGRVAASIAGPVPSRRTLTELVEDVAGEGGRADG